MAKTLVYTGKTKDVFALSLKTTVLEKTAFLIRVKIR